MRLRFRDIIVLLAVLLAAVPASAYYETGEADEAEYIPSILQIEGDPAEAISELEGRGVIVWRHRADMVLALVPRESESPARIRGVRRVEQSRRAMPVMDVAKTYYDASLMHTGQGLPRPYTGKGVVVGFCDTGFDPNHVNFLDADGRTRVRRLVYYDEPHGIRRVLDTPEEIAAWTTDNRDEYHGTHVAGILTGSYNGNGYGGMAPDAEIVATTSQLYDAGILSACEDIIEYAKLVGKPAVINLSLGSYNGPHDGTSLFCRYMELLGREAIVFMATGNEAGRTNSARITFSERQSGWRVRIHSTDWVQFDMYGMTDAWSYDSRPIGVRFSVYDEVTRQPVYRTPLYEGPEPFEAGVSSATDSEFAKYMTGEVRLRGYISDLNGRWVTELEYDTHTDEANPEASGHWARYNIAAEYTGAPGVSMDVTSDCQYSRLVQWPGYKAPGADLSVSDICTGANVVAVGMYNNRRTTPQLNGEERVFTQEPFTICSSSSYGTTITGRELPHTVAPGAAVVSSANRYYAQEHPDQVPTLSAQAKIDGETYYWAVNYGTSMSTPYVAGSVAAWLEANPGLAVDEVLDIIAASNTHDYPDLSNPRHGQGWFRPYEGLKRVLRYTDSAPGILDSASPAIVIRGNVAEILNPGQTELRAAVYSADGSQVLPACTSHEPVGIIDLSPLRAGVYIMRVEGAGHTPVSRKFVR